MSKANPLRILVYILPIIVLCSPASAQNRTGEITLENIGKENPFEIVKPLADVKKNIIERIIKPTTPEMQSVQVTVQEELPDMYMQMVMLKFLQAASLEPVTSNLLSPYGKVSIDTASNSILICDTADNLKKIITEIKKVDKTPQQVMIEVVIVDVKLEDDTEIGVNWTHVAGRGNTESFTQSLVTTLATAGTSGMDFTFLHDGIDVTVHALQEVRDVEILASPKVMVLSGQSALIQTVEEIPYEEAGEASEGGTLTSTEFKEVGVTLNVTALVTDEQRIRITVQPEQSVNTGRTGLSAGNDIPIIDIRRADTTLLMEDGQVVVLGGLRRRNLKNSIDKVPLLGDLPLIGFLFSRDKTEIEHTELVVFLSPHIYKGEPLTEEEQRQFDQLRNSPPPRFERHRRSEYEFIRDVLDEVGEKIDLYPE